MIPCVEEHKLEEEKWWVFCDPSNPSPDLVRLFHYRMNIKRYAYADALKDSTHKYLRLENCHVHSFEQVKNSLLVQDPNKATIWKTIRQWYIDYGCWEREKDKQVWARKINSQIEKEKIPLKIIDMITDFRFRNEPMDRKYEENNEIIHVKAADISTIRLWRPEVKEAPLSESSEHDLDNFQTKYLFVGANHKNINGEAYDEDQFQLAVDRFPQYRDFRYCYTLILPSSE